MSAISNIVRTPWITLKFGAPFATNQLVTILPRTGSERSGRSSAAIIVVIYRPTSGRSKRRLRVRSAGQRTGEITVKDGLGELNGGPLPGAASSTGNGRNGREADPATVSAQLLLLAQSGWSEAL
jgi:hypothetical protein